MRSSDPTETAPARHPFRYWPALVLLAGLTCPLVFSTWYTFDRQREALETAFHLELEHMTSVVADGMREPIWNLSPALGRALLDSVMVDERVFAVHVTSLAQGEFLSAERDAQATEPTLRFTRPVARGDRQIGEVTIEADATAVRARLDEQWPEIYALGVLQGLLGLGVVGYVYWALRRQEREEALREMNRRLSEEVEARARALEAANEELLRQENLAVLGRLTAMVSHELRNPLGTISNSIELMSRFARGDPEAPDQESIHRTLERAHRNIERCSRIADELLGFTRSDSGRREPTEIDAWLEDILADYPFPPGIAVERDLGCAATIRVDRERLRRAVTNLLGNAVQAIDASGRDAGRLAVRSVATGDGVELHVRDTGDGIAPELRDQIFEPLFSTRNVGFGLGLPLVRQIVEQHGGDVAIVEVPEGAEFVIRLPADPPRRGERAG